MPAHTSHGNKHPCLLSVVSVAALWRPCGLRLSLKSGTRRCGNMEVPDLLHAVTCLVMSREKGFAVAGLILLIDYD